MSTSTSIPKSNPGPRTGPQLHDHQKVGLSKLLFMENDYRSLYEAMVREDDKLDNLKYLDLSAFPHMWQHEGGTEWSTAFSDKTGEEDIRPLQGKGMILADEMVTGKSIIILALIEASMKAIDDWINSPLAESEIPTYRLPKEYRMDDIYIDTPPLTNVKNANSKCQFWSDNMFSNPETKASELSPLKRSRATLIICPKTVMGVWEKIIKNHWDGWIFFGTMNTTRHLPAQDRPLLVYSHYQNQRSEDRDALTQADIVITSYEGVQPGEKKSNLIKDLIFYRVILDEGHHVNVSSTLRYKHIDAIHKRHIHILSGTPILNDLNELNTYARLFDLPCGLTSSTMFQRIITTPAYRKDTTLIRNFGDIFSIRRLKTELNDGVEDRSQVPWASNSTRLGSNDDQARDKWLAEFSTRKQWWSRKYIPITAKDSIKMKWFRFFLEERKDGKIVVFHHWKHTATIAKKVLEENAYHIQSLTADMNTEDRIKYTKKFNEDPEQKFCLLASIKVGGEGMSMTGANICVFLDLMWNPAWHAQGMDRLHRQGQTKPVTVYMPMTRGTYEEEIWLRQNTKRGFLNLIYPNDPPGKLRLTDYPAELLQWLRDNPDPIEEGDENDEAEN
ncbi:uncharacterized protein L201_003363 [Kwoniella dendrophila CBS 6074]|uniref:Uncharacterized protein n=1 Tax=Kwoniella dendrophila CBS 6074 TaxID=1295534 RepID=A0AAX4JV60_9TREE